MRMHALWQCQGDVRGVVIILLEFNFSFQVNKVISDVIQYQNASQVKENSQLQVMGTLSFASTFLKYLPH